MNTHNRCGSAFGNGEPMRSFRIFSRRGDAAAAQTPDSDMAAIQVGRRTGSPAPTAAAAASDPGLACGPLSCDESSLPLCQDTVRRTYQPERQGHHGHGDSDQGPTVTSDGRPAPANSFQKPIENAAYYAVYCKMKGSQLGMTQKTPY